MATYTAGSASLDIVPSMRGFFTTLKSELKATNPGALLVDVSPDMKAFNQKVRAGIGKAPTLQIRAEINKRDLAKAEADVVAAEKRMEAARNATTDSVAAVDIAEKRLEETRKKSGAGSSQAAAAELRLAQANRAASAAANDAKNATDRLTASRDKVKEVRTRVDVDTSQAESALGRFKAAMADADSSVKRGSSSSSSSLLGLSRTAQVAVVAIAAIGPAAAGVWTLGSAAASASKSLAILPALLSTVGAVAGTVAVGGHGLGDAFKAMAKESSSAGAGVGKSTSGLVSAQKSLARATEDAATSRENAARQVAEATVAAADSIAAAELSSSRQVRSAEESLVASKRSLKDAQEDVTRAVRDATEAQEDLAFSVRGASITEKQAVLDLKKSTLDLQNARDSGVDGDALERVVNAYDQQVLALDMAKDRSKDLQAQQVESAQAGVNGSALVVAARAKESAAAEEVGLAERSLTETKADAERSLAVTRAQATKSIADAERAREESAKQSSRALADATDAVKEASNGGAAAVNKYNEALAKLSPNARELVTTVKALSGEWRSMANSVQDRLFADVAADVRALSGTYLPVLKNGMGGIADSVNNTGHSFADMLLQARNVDSVGLILANAKTQTDNLGKAVPFAGQAFLDFAVVGGEVLNDLTGGVGGLAEKWADWTRKSRDSGALERNMREGVQSVKDLYDSIAVLGSTGLMILKAVAGGFTGVSNDTRTASQVVLDAALRFQQWAQSHTAMFTQLGETSRSALTLITNALAGVHAVLSPVISLINTLLSETGDSAANIAVFAGALYALNKLSFGGLKANFLDTVGSIKTGVSEASTISGKMGGIAGGLMSAFSPLTIGLGLAGIALAEISRRQAEAAQKTADHKASVQTLTAALNEDAGAMGRATAAAVAKAIADKNGASNATAFGSSLGELASAATGNARAQDSVLAKANAVIDGFERQGLITSESARSMRQLNVDLAATGGTAADKVHDWGNLTEAQKAQIIATENGVGAMGDQRKSLDDAAKSIGDNEAAQRKLNAAARDIEPAAVAAQAGTDKLKGAFKALSEQSGTTETKAQAVLDILNQFAGTQPGVEESTKKWNDFLRGIVEGFKTGENGAVQFDKSAIGIDGTVNTLSASGSKLYETLDTAKTNMAQYAQALRDSGKPQADVTAALKTQQDALKGVLTQLGLTPEQIDAVVTHYGLLPEKVSTAVFLENTPAVKQQIEDIATKLAALKPGASIPVKALTAEAETALVTLGYHVVQLPDGTFQVFGDTTEGRAAADALVRDYNGKEITLQVIAEAKTAAAEAELNRVARDREANINAVFKGITEGGYYLDSKNQKRSIGNTGLAAGGPVAGPGSGTSDSIPAMLSNGEYVMPADKTSRYRALLDAMRAGTLLRFAAGGPVGSSPTVSGAGVSATAETSGIVGITVTAALASEALIALATTITTVLNPVFAAMSLANTTAVSTVLANDNALSARDLLLAQQITADWVNIGNAVWASVNSQGVAFGALQNGLDSVRSAMAYTADWAVAQFGRIRGAAADPIRWVLQQPFNAGIITAWNKLDSEFAMGKQVSPVPIGFATGGRVPGNGNRDTVPAMLMPGEVVFSKQAIANLGGVDAVAALHSSARSGNLQNDGLIPDNYNARLHFAYGGVVPSVAAAGDELTRLFGPFPGGIGGVAGRANHSDHPFGYALDFMSNNDTGLGNRAASYLQSNAKRLAVKYLIWQRKFNQGAGWVPYTGPNPHTDHVHASFLGGPLGPEGSSFGGIGGSGGFFDPATMVNDAFASTYTLIDDVTKKFAGTMATQGQGIARKAADGVKTAALDKIGMTGGLSNPAIGGDAKAAQDYARSMLGRFGWGPEQMGPLISLWNGESGWNSRAKNPSSGAYGIPQALPGNKMATAGADWMTNPATQINWGLGYIKDRKDYGSPAAAYAKWQSRNPHWYDNGGVASGVGLLAKDIIEPERMLSATQTLAFDRLVSYISAGDGIEPANPDGGHNTAPTIHQNVYPAPGMDERAIATDSSRRIAFALRNG